MLRCFLRSIEVAENAVVYPRHPRNRRGRPILAVAADRARRARTRAIFGRAAACRTIPKAISWIPSARLSCLRNEVSSIERHARSCRNVHKRPDSKLSRSRHDNSTDEIYPDGSARFPIRHLPKVIQLDRRAWSNRAMIVYTAARATRTCRRISAGIPTRRVSFTVTASCAASFQRGDTARTCVISRNRERTVMHTSRSVARLRRRPRSDARRPRRAALGVVSVETTTTAIAMSQTPHAGWHAVRFTAGQ